MYKANVKKISEFWNKHFIFKETTVIIAKYKTLDLFHKIHGNSITYHDFTAISGVVGVKTKTTR